MLQRAIDSGKLDAGNPIMQKLLSSWSHLQARDGVRILGNGICRKKLQLEVAGASKSAVSSVENNGQGLLSSSTNE